MMKRLLFISREDDRTDYDTAKSMANQFGEGDLTARACFLEDLVFKFDGEKLHVTDMISGQDIADCDGIFLLGWFKSKILEDIALAVTMYAEAKGIAFLNDETRINRSKTKLSQYVASALHGIQSTPFIFTSKKAAMLSVLGSSNVDYPLILKSTMASRGKDNYLIRDEANLSSVLTDNPEIPFVIQTFIPNKGDYRILVMGDEVRLVMLRQSVDDSHLNNTSQGGTAKLVDPASVSQQMLAEAIQIAKLLHRNVTGVDMIIHQETGEHYFLEANNMPQLSTGSFVSEKMAALNNFLNEWLTSK